MFQKSNTKKFGFGFKRGFTLVELLVVLVILAVVAAIVLPKFVDSSRRAKIAKVRHDLRILRVAIDRFRSDTGAYPMSLDDLAATTAPTKGLDKNGGQVNIMPTDWNGPYVASIPIDVLANKPFVYHTSPPMVGMVVNGDSASAQATAGTRH